MSAPAHQATVKTIRRILDTVADMLNAGENGIGAAFTDQNSPSGAMYQVRACRLEVTGAGSYWNPSQAQFITVP